MDCTQYYPPMSVQGSPDELFTQFITAIKSSSFQQVENILHSTDPAIVNRIEPQFREPSLYFAALVPGDEESAELIKLLIRNGANVKFKDHNEQTILFYICREGKERCAELLLSHGLSLDDLDVYGQTPIFYAGSENRLEIIAKYATKERVLHVDKLAGQTPIYYAARRGHLEMVRLLFEKGADLTMLDTNNKSVIEYAKKAKFPEVAEFLAAELKKIKDLNKITSLSDETERRAVRRGKEETSKDTKLTYKIVFYNDKGEPHDLTEAEVKKLTGAKPDLMAFLEDPETIPAEALAQTEEENWEKVANKILGQVGKLKGGYYFLEAVDPVKFNIMDYFDIVTQPMDLGTVRRKLTHNCYRQPEEFVRDMHLIWGNSYRYNGDNHVVSKCGREVEVAFNDMVQNQGLAKYLGQPPKTSKPVHSANLVEAVGPLKSVEVVVEAVKEREPVEVVPIVEVIEPVKSVEEAKVVKEIEPEKGDIEANKEEIEASKQIEPEKEEIDAVEAQEPILTEQAPQVVEAEAEAVPQVKEAAEEVQVPQMVQEAQPAAEPLAASECQEAIEEAAAVADEEAGSHE